MEIGQQQVGGAETVAGGDEDVGVAVKGADHAVFARRAFQGAQARWCRPPRCARPPHARRSAAPPWPASSTARSACMRCWLVSSAVTGRKVPSPTCRVTLSRATPLRLQRRKQLRREMQARGGRGHRALLRARTGSGNRPRPGHRLCACRRYRAAAASRPARRWRRPAPRRTGRSGSPLRRLRPAPRPARCKRAEHQRIARRQLRAGRASTE